MTACEPLELEILPPYIGSAVSPTVDITETTDDITVTITDFRGEHAYTVDKTDQAIADAEQAATNANTAAANATSTANQAAQAATQAAGTANTAAQNADAKAALADSKAALANQAATTANQAAEAAEAAKTAANTAAGQATTAATNATTAAGTANTAAGNADVKAQLADTAATNADTATQAANTATTNATNAAQTANNAAAVAIEAAEDMPRLIGTVDTAQTVADAWPTTMEGATLYGKFVQDGTPTPDNPVPVQVVGGRNLYNLTEGTNAGVTMTKDADGAYVFNGTSTGFASFEFSEVLPAGIRTLSVKGDAIGTTANTMFVRTRSEDNTIRHQISMATVQNWGTITNGNPIAKCVVNFQSGITFDNYKLYVQLEAGTHATPYTPYGCIGLQTGETVTPIDLQGHTLAGLPDGTRDELDIDAAGVKKIVQRVGYIASYNDESVGSVYVSTTGELATGASVYYKLDTPIAHELGTITLFELPNPCELAMYASLDPEWAIQYTQDPSIVVNTLQSSIAPVEGATASTNYAVGAYLMHGNQLYRVTSAIATGEAITPGSNCVACTVMGELARLTA